MKQVLIKVLSLVLEHLIELVLGHKQAVLTYLHARFVY